MIKKEIKNVTNFLSPSGLPGIDYSINPYVGCPHKCVYCYADFMKRFTNHKEPWGDFIDIKVANKKISLEKISLKKIAIGSVTDPYNWFEKQHQTTQHILEMIKDTDAYVTIITKSDLILRDIDLLKQFKNLEVAISINTTDDKFREIIEPMAPSVDKRFEALKTLHQAGIKTVLFMAPMFPEITNYKDIILKTKDYVDIYWLENLNLRSAKKHSVLELIYKNYHQYAGMYKAIYLYKEKTYWKSISNEIETFLNENNKKFVNFFHHGSIKKKN